MKSEKYWIWFSRIEKLNCIQKENILRDCGTPEKVWNLNEGQLQTLSRKYDIDYNQIMELMDDKYRKNIDEYEKYMIKHQIRMVTIFDREYPISLRNIYDKPIVLFTKGNINLLKKRCIAIVGSRNCTEYGKNIAKKLAKNLSEQGLCIASGLARGVDKYAHIGALEGNGSTIAVIRKWIR